jgi:hypothetical protein
LADLMRYRVKNRSRDRVNCAARLKWRYELDRLPRRPSLALGFHGENQTQQDKRQERCASHRMLLGERAHVASRIMRVKKPIRKSVGAAAGRARRIRPSLKAGDFAETPHVSAREDIQQGNVRAPN